MRACRPGPVHAGPGHFSFQAPRRGVLGSVAWRGADQLSPVLKDPLLHRRRPARRCRCPPSRVHPAVRLALVLAGVLLAGAAVLTPVRPAVRARDALLAALLAPRRALVDRLREAEQ